MKHTVFRTLLYAGLLLLLAVLVNSGAVIRQDEEIPYIHYYDSLNPRLIIERVDGSHSRAIDTIDNRAPIWSASGEWMIVGNLQIIRTDGQRQLSNPQSDTSLHHVSRWSPTDDVLLLVGTNWQDGSIHAQLYDIEQEIVLADFEVQYFGFDPPNNFDLHWSANGEIAYIFWSNHLVTLHQDGQAELRINRNGSPFDFYQGRLVHRSMNENYEDALIIEDLETGRWIELMDEFDRPANLFHIGWSSTLDHALVYAHPCRDESCDAWLKLIDWDAGDIINVSQSAIIYEDYFECSYTLVCNELWSPVDNFVIFKDVDNVTHIINASSGETILNDEIAYYRWTDDEQLYVLFGGTDGIYLYDPRIDETIEINPSKDMSFSRFGLSPQGNYLTVLTESYATVIDNQGNLLTQTIPHSHSIGTSGYPSSYTWHSDENWIMANYIIAIAGGGNGPSASVLFDINGTVRRELPTGGSAGFVPERAIPYLGSGEESSLTKYPILTLAQTGFVTGVGWHPTDPNRLVTYSEEAGLIFWLLNEVEALITDQFFPDTPYASNSPLGLRLFWFPEQDIIAFGSVRLHHFDEYGEVIPITGVDYPILDVREGILQPIGSDTVIQLEHDVGFLWQLSSDLQGFINAEPPLYLNARTGDMTQLDTYSFLATIDANQNIAVFGYMYDCCIRVVSTESGRELDEFNATAFSLALSSDGQRLATTSRGMIAIWDMSEYYSEDG